MKRLIQYKKVFQCIQNTLFCRLTSICICSYSMHTKEFFYQRSERKCLLRVELRFSSLKHLFLFHALTKEFFYSSSKRKCLLRVELCFSSSKYLLKSLKPTFIKMPSPLGTLSNIFPPTCSIPAIYDIIWKFDKLLNQHSWQICFLGVGRIKHLDLNYKNVLPLLGVACFMT